jgi:hypothetical protein
MRARKSDSGDKLAYGLSFVFFGLLFLLDILGFFRLLHLQTAVMDWRNYFIYAGIIFLCAKKEKALGVVLLIVGLFLRFQIKINGYLPVYSVYFWPVLMIIIGAVLLIMVLRK